MVGGEEYEGRSVDGYGFVEDLGLMPVLRGEDKEVKAEFGF